MNSDEPIEPTQEDARRLLSKAGVAARGSEEITKGFSRVDLCLYLLRWVEEAGGPEATTVDWDTPLVSLLGEEVGEANLDAGDWLESSEVGGLMVASELSELRTFGDALLYIEKRVAQVHWDPTEPEILNDLREYLPFATQNRSPDFGAATPTEEILPWGITNQDTTFREHLTRRYGVSLPSGEVFLGGMTYDYLFLGIWAILLIVGGAFLWRFGLWAVALWVVVSPFLLQAILGRSTRLIWPREVNTLGGLAQYIQTANLVTYRRIKAALQNEED